MFYEFEFFQPIDFLRLSEEMYNNVDSFESMPSAVKRTVISRIYYSTFLYVRRWLIKHGYCSTKGDHAKIPNYISTDGPFSPIDNKYISSELIRLKKLRHQADYYVTRDECLRYGEVWIPDEIESAFESAQDIIEKFKNKN